MPDRRPVTKRASEGTIREYLMECYGLTKVRAEEVMSMHPETVVGAIRVGSFAYYPADEIAKDESLIELEFVEDYDEDEGVVLN